MQETLIDQGLSLMLYGMGTVFTFLTILVFATSLMSKLVAKFAPDEPDTAAANVNNTIAADKVTNTSQQPDASTLEAIKQAIALHRNR